VIRYVRESEFGQQLSIFAVTLAIFAIRWVGFDVLANQVGRIKLNSQLPAWADLRCVHVAKIGGRTLSVSEHCGCFSIRHHDCCKSSESNRDLVTSIVREASFQNLTNRLSVSDTRRPNFAPYAFLRLA